MKNRIIEAAIISFGIIILGLSIRSGVTTFKDKERVVSVKGLAEVQLPADKITWPLMFKDIGNDLGTLYDNLNIKNEAIIAFLRSKNVTDQEISVGAPEIIDMRAERYQSENVPYRYNITSVITVTSDDVDKIRAIIAGQNELLKQGIAITSGDYRYNISYDFTRLNDVKPQMIEEATKNARNAAEKFAIDSNSKLGKIKRANQGQFTISDRDPNTPYIKTIRVVTTVDYYLED